MMQFLIVEVKRNNLHLFMTAYKLFQNSQTRFKILSMMQDVRLF